MALSGDTNTSIACVLFNQSFSIDEDGKIVSDFGKRISNVIQVIDGSIEDVLHLIGYNQDKIEELLENGILKSSFEINEKISEFPERLPGVFLLEKDELLYGVVIDENHQAKLVGVVCHVLPMTKNGEKYESVIVSANGSWKLSNLNQQDITTIRKNESNFGIVVLDGFFFLQIGLPGDGLAELVLILEDSYFIIEKVPIECVKVKEFIRQENGQNEVVITKLTCNECIVSSCGGCIRTTEGLKIYGKSNTIINSFTLQSCLFSMNQPTENGVPKDVFCSEIVSSNDLFVVPDEIIENLQSISIEEKETQTPTKLPEVCDANDLCDGHDETGSKVENAEETA